MNGINQPPLGGTVQRVIRRGNSYRASVVLPSAIDPEAFKRGAEIAEQMLRNLKSTGGQ